MTAKFDELTERYEANLNEVIAEYEGRQPRPDEVS